MGYISAEGIQQGEKEKAIRLALKYMSIGHTIEEAAAFSEISVTDIIQASNQA